MSEYKEKIIKYLERGGVIEFIRGNIYKQDDYSTLDRSIIRELVKEGIIKFDKPFYKLNDNVSH